MAFFDFLLGGSPMKRHARRVTDRDAQPEDREASAHWLAENGTEEALVALCNRFSLQLEHSIKDKKEKDMVFDLLVSRGAEGSRIARQYAKSNASFAWPVRIIEKVEGATAGVVYLLELLARESVDNELHPEKKRNLLIALAERKNAEIVNAGRPFLADFDEGVRHAAIEALAAQDGDEPREALLGALCNPKEESTRIRGRLAEICALRKWAVGDDAWLAAHVPNGFRLVDGRLVDGRL